jgi:hypothetical protein
MPLSVTVMAYVPDVVFSGITTEPDTCPVFADKAHEGVTVGLPGKLG